MIVSQQRSRPHWNAGAGYLLAVVVTLLAHGISVAFKQAWPSPSFMFFIPAVAISAWFGGLGPSILATAMSLALIRINLFGPGWLVAGPREGWPSALAFLVVALTIAVLKEALRRSRVLADSHAANLERLNQENQRIAKLATRLLEVSTSLSEAQSVDEVAEVVLSKGLAVVEAARGVLVSVDMLTSVPAPVIRSALTVSSAPHWAIMRPSAGDNSAESALRASGRFSVSVATPSRIRHMSWSVPVSMLRSASMMVSSSEGLAISRA